MESMPVLSLVDAARLYNFSESSLRKIVYQGGVRYVREFSAYQKRIIRYFIYRTDLEDIKVRSIFLDRSKWVTIAEACKTFNLTRRKMYYLATKGKVRSQVFSGKRKVFFDDIKEYLKKSGEKPSRMP